MYRRNIYNFGFGLKHVLATITVCILITQYTRNTLIHECNIIYFFYFFLHKFIFLILNDVILLQYNIKEQLIIIFRPLIEFILNN